MGSKVSENEPRVVMNHLRRIVRALRVSARAAEKESGLSGAQLFVLQSLAEAPASSMSELAARTATDQSSVSVVVSRLVERGLVSRHEARDDARRFEIRLTAAGRTLRHKTPQLVQARIVGAIQALPRSSRAELARLLGELVAKLDLDGQPQMFFEEEPPSGARPARTARRRVHARA
jgi:DNA-binding MarR family transcriptional regulator